MKGRSCAPAEDRPAAFKPRTQALALVLGAVAVQAAFLLETASSLFFRYPLVDAATCHAQALALLAGQAAPGAFWQAPGYPYFLAALEWAAGQSPAAARSLQALLLAPLLSLLVWRVGLRVLPPAWAFGAGLAAAVTGPLFFYASQLLPAFPAAVLVTAALLLALRAEERPSSLFRWLAAGAAAGLATVVVATSAALVPALAWLAWRRPGGARRWLRTAAALAAGFLLAVLPVSLRNYAQSGRWVWLSTNGGINLYVGNSGAEPSPLTFQPGLDWDELVRRPFVLGRAKDDADASRWFSRQVADGVRGDPAGHVKRLARKALVFWHGRELPRNIDLYGWRGESRLLGALVWRQGLCFPAGLLVPLAVLGAFALRRSRPALFVALSAAAFGLLVAVFFPCSRYRVPVLPGLVVLAAAGARACCAALREGPWRRAAAWGAAAAALGVAANLPVSWPTDAVRYDARLQNAAGASADVAGKDLLLAKACHEAALRLDPNFADASFDLGSVFERLGYPAAAEACYASALASRPDHDKAQVNLALHLSRRGQTDEALRHLLAAEAANPLNANAWYNHAAVLLKAGRRREALASLGKTAELAPAYRGQYQRLLKEAVACGPDPARFPELLFTSEAAKKIQRYDAAGNVVWEYPADTARDVWQLPNGNVLFPYSVSNGVGEAETGAMEVTPDKRVVWRFKTRGQVYSCQRMADGNTLVGATQQGRLLVVSPAGEVVKSLTVKNAAAGHSSMRNVRALADGHFLVAEESAKAAREYDADGKLLREFKTPFPTYSAVRLPSGHTVTCGKTGILEFDAEGRPVWELKNTEVPELGIRWFAGLQVLPNGNLFICNAGGKVPFAEISRDKKIVWQCDPARVAGGIGHGIQRLDVPGEPLK